MLLKLEKMDLQIENLKALANGRDLNAHQRGYALYELNDLLKRVNKSNEVLKEVLDNDKDYKNCTSLSVWTRSKIQNALKK